MRGPVELAPGVHGLGTDIVNFFAVHEDGRLTLVDAGLPGYAKTLDDDLRRIGRTRADVEAVVLTHSDADHTGMAPVLQASGARILIHEADDAAPRKPGPKPGDGSAALT